MLVMVQAILQGGMVPQSLAMMNCIPKRPQTYMDALSFCTPSQDPPQERPLRRKTPTAPLIPKRDQKWITPSEKLSALGVTLVITSSSTTSKVPCTVGHTLQPMSM